MPDKREDTVKRLNDLFRVASNAQSSQNRRKDKINSEQFYYNDVEDTLSQDTKKQSHAVYETFNIPVSSKISFAVIELFLSHLTATKPFPRYINAEASTEGNAEIYHKLFHATWYESHGYDVLYKVIKDSLVIGDGYMRVKENDFFNETTTNIVFEYIPWKRVFIDPESKDSHYRDATYIVVADIMRKDKAEKLFDIKLVDDENMYDDPWSANTSTDLVDSFLPFGIAHDKEYRYVWIKEYYERELVNVYIGDNPYENRYGLVSITRPEPIEIDNPEYVQLLAKIKETENGLAASKASTVQPPDQSGYVGESPDVETFKARSQMAEMQNQQYGQQVQEQEQAIAMLNEMKLALNKLPKTIPAYEMENAGSKVIITTMRKMQTKRIRYTHMVGNHIVSSKILSTDNMPIINFPFVHNNSPILTYGMLHFFKDLVKAINKYIKQVMFAIATWGHRRGFYFEHTIVEPKDLEENKPTGWTKIKFHPQMPEGGMPKVMEPAPINDSITYMLRYFMELIEYITGFNTLNQGDPKEAPNTFGATASLQSFGTQRIKSYSRNLETSFEQLALVAVSFFQKFTPRDTVIKYFDDNNDAQEIRFLDDETNTKFKVRVDVTNFLPSTRQMTAQLVGFIAQTFGDDQMKRLAMEHMLKILDVPEGKEFSDQLNSIMQLQDKINQDEDLIKELNASIETLTNNLAQKEMALRVEKMVNEAEGKLNGMVKEAEVRNQVEQEQKQEAADAEEYEFPSVPEAPMEEENQLLNIGM